MSRRSAIVIALWGAALLLSARVDGQYTMDGRAIRPQTLPLSAIAASSASSGQVPVFNGTQWVAGSGSGSGAGGMSGPLGILVPSDLLTVSPTFQTSAGTWTLAKALAPPYSLWANTSASSANMSAVTSALPATMGGTGTS